MQNGLAHIGVHDDHLGPVCAMVMARLEQVVDLPALGSALVTTTAFSAAVDSMNSRLARIAL